MLAPGDLLRTCPTVGVVSTEPEQPERPLAEAPAKSKTPWWAYAVVAALVGIVAFIATRNPHHSATPDEQKADAARACEEKFIPARLKAPASAKFSNVAVTTDGTSYRVQGLVDSQNSFGAMIRSTFTCVMHSSGDQWTLDSADVQGQ